MASTPRALPSADEILAREATQKRLAIITAIASAILTAITAIIDQVVNAGVPKATNAADLVETLSATATGADFPSSFWATYAAFRIDHGAVTILANTMRGAAFVLLIPMMLLLLRGARERGGTLGKWLEPLVVTALTILGVAIFVHEILEVQAFRGTSPEFVPQDILDAVSNTDVLALSSLIGIVSLAVALPVSLVAIQSMRVGLLPRVLGFMGVLVGLLFVLNVDKSGLLRAGWFAAVAWVVAGRLAPELAPAWKTGTAVLPEPRQPPPPKAPKGSKGEKPPKLTK